jgi:hypothetical protein
MELGLAASQAASGPASALTWRLDEAAFDATMIELFRRGDAIPIRLLLDQALAETRELIDREDGESELSALLDRIVSLAALALDLDQPKDFDRSVDTLMAIYELGFGGYGVPRNTVAVPVAKFWVMIVERVYALGALAVRREHWQAVRRLALARGQSRGWKMEGYRSWLRHALTMGARSHVARFETRRVTPVVVRMIEDRDARNQVAPL